VTTAADVFRPATPQDADALTALERDTNLVALAHVFPGVSYPYDEVRARWARLLADPQVQAANPAFPIAAKNKLNARPSYVAQYAQVSQAIYNNVNAALSGSVSPQAALSSANTQIDSALGNSGL